MDGHAVQRDVLHAFEFAHNRADWVTPLADANAYHIGQITKMRELRTTQDVTA